MNFIKKNIVQSYINIIYIHTWIYPSLQLASINQNSGTSFIDKKLFLINIS